MKLDSNDMKFFAMAAAAAIVLALLLRPVVLAALGAKDVPLPTWASPGRVSALADSSETTPTTPMSASTATSSAANLSPSAAPRITPSARPRKLTYYEQTRSTSTRASSSAGRRTGSSSAAPHTVSSSTSAHGRRQSHTSAEAYARAKQRTEADRLTKQVTYWQAEYERMRRDKIYEGLVDTLEKLGKAKADLARVQSQTYIDNLVQQHRLTNPTPASTPRKPTAAEREAVIRERARLEAQKTRIYKEEFEKVGLAPPQ